MAPTPSLWLRLWGARRWERPLARPPASGRSGLGQAERTFVPSHGSTTAVPMHWVLSTGLSHPGLATSRGQRSARSTQSSRPLDLLVPDLPGLRAPPAPAPGRHPNGQAH